jgi:iron complex transport system ATP-binding protein
MHELSDIRVAHDGRVALRIDRLAFRAGDFTVLLGHNGSGKSTLFWLLARERAPDGGEVRLDGAPLARWPGAWPICPSACPRRRG